MVIESVVICLDNSDYMRNEDYQPDRLTAQVDALTVLIYAKMRLNRENYLASITMANNQVLTHLTNSEAKLLNDLSKVEIGGNCRILQSLSVAQLVLKHRPIKHAKCKIIVFLGSPIETAESDLIILAKKFKKENIMMDVVTFGGEIGVGVLRTMVDTLNGAVGTNNTFSVVPSRTVLADWVVSSGLVSAHRDFVPQDDEDDVELRRAIEWSLRETGRPEAAPSTAQPTGIQDGNALSDDEQLLLAMQLSLQEAERARPVSEVQPPTTHTRPTEENRAISSAPNSSSNPSNSNSSTDGNSETSAGNPPTSTRNNNNTPNNSNKDSDDTKNNNNHRAAAGNADPGKNPADPKETKKTILTKKR